MSDRDPLRDVILGVSECLAAGFLDLHERVLTGIQVSQDDGTLARLCAAAAQDLLDMTAVRTLERLRPDVSSAEAARPLQVVLRSPAHLFVLEWESAERALVVVCRSTADWTEVVTQLRSVLSTLEAERACP